MDFDTFLKHVGEFGWYQKKHYFMLCFINVISVFTAMDLVFTTALPDHWCKIPDILQNLTLSEQKEIAIPLMENGEYSRCKINNLTGWKNNTAANFSSDFYVTEVLNCDSWEYDSILFGSTIVSQWNLVCGKEWIASSPAAISGFGKLFGSAIGGILCDRFGRRRMLLIFLTLTCTAGMLSAFSPLPHVYLVASFFRGLILATYVAAVTLIMELVGAEWRDTALSVINWWWCAGYLLVGGIAFLVRDWFKLELILHGSGFILVFLYAWQTPESPRWLLQQNRTKEAMKILKEMAVTNGIKWEEELDNVHVDEDKKTKVTLMKLTKSDTMVIITMISCYMWAACNLIFFGLSYNTSNLAGDPYLNFIISGIVEVPAYGVQWFMLPRLGKRWTVFTTFMLSGVALLATLPVPPEHAIATTVLAMIGKFAASIVFGSIYIYTPEMYPTLYRSTGLGMSSMAGRIGGIAAPYMALLGTVTSPEIPLVIFGISSTIAALSALLLPETDKMILPETLDDVHQFQENMFSCGERKHAAKPVSNTDEENSNEMAARNTLLIKDSGDITDEQVL